MTDSKKRIAKLQQLMHDEYQGKQVLLANRLGRQADYISRLFNGKKGLGADLARQFEDLLEKPKYWLDGDESNVAAGPDIRGRVPLISWVRAGEFCEAHEPFAPGDAEMWLDCPVPHGPNTYCLRVVGRSMDNDDVDGYREGEILFVDPDKEALPGVDVIVRTPDHTCTFKRLKLDEDGLYLLALNTKWENRYIRIPVDAEICGVVVFSGRERYFK